MGVPSFVYPLAGAILTLLVMWAVFAFIKNQRLNVPPSKVAVISGRTHTYTLNGETTKRGFRLVRGGGTFILPIFERKDEMELGTINLPQLEVKNGITKEGVPLTVKAVANVKIGSEDALLVNAVERLMGKTLDEIKKIAYETLEGHLRSILGTLTVEDINGDRQAFQGRMIAESQEDLARLGLKIDVLTIKELSDDHGYLAALGLKRTAEIKRDAEIGRADAEREATIKSTTAEKDGALKQQENLALVAQATKDKDVKVAQFLAETQAETARANQAGPRATAEAQKAVVEAEQAVQLARTLKATEVAKAEQERTQQELIATTIRPAEAKRDAAIAVAEGEARAVSIKATAEKEKRIAEGEGEAQAIRLRLTAEADGVKARLLAEAEGVLKKAEAYKELDGTQAGQLLQILEAAQTLVPKAISEFAKVLEAAARPMGDIDKVIVLDSGSGGNGEGSALNRYASVAPGLVFNLIERFGAMGIDISGLLGKGGVKAEAETAVVTSGPTVGVAKAEAIKK